MKSCIVKLQKKQEESSRSVMKEEKNVREMLLSQPIRIVHLMIWNEMTDSELIAILEKVNQELYHDYREKMRSLEKK